MVIDQKQFCWTDVSTPDLGFLSSHVSRTNLFITRCLAISLERYQQLAAPGQLEITTKYNRTTHARMIRYKNLASLLGMEEND